MTQSTDANDRNERTSDGGSDGSGVEVLRNGLVGGTAAVLLAFLPLSTVLGGGIAGYLQARTQDGVARAGAIAGLIGFVPHVVVGAYLTAAPDFVPPGPDVGLAPEYLLGGVLVFGVVYAVGLGILGGVLGGYVRSMYSNRRRRPDRPGRPPTGEPASD